MVRTDRIKLLLNNAQGFFGLTESNNYYAGGQESSVLNAGRPKREKKKTDRHDTVALDREKKNERQRKNLPMDDL